MTSQREPVVVGIDGSTPARHAVRWAAQRASRDGVPLRIIHAYQLPNDGVARRRGHACTGTS